MTENGQHVDHKAEALECINRAWTLGRENGEDEAIPIHLAAAHVHSNLAIAEGQERVAEELKGLRRQLDFGQDRPWQPAGEH